MTSRKSKFVLTKRHLYDGLTAQDMTDYVGIPIIVAAHDDFPHSDELGQSQELSSDKLYERKVAMSKFMADRNLKESLALKTHSEGIVSSATMSLESTKLTLLECDEFGAWNPYNVHHRFKLAAEEASRNANDVWVVAPKSPHMTLEEAFPIVWQGTEAFVLSTPRTIEPRVYWGERSFIAAQILDEAPPVLLALLSDLLHEMRHIAQLSAKTHFGYFCEVDANLFERAVLREELPKLGINPEEQLKADMMANYAGLFLSETGHQIAPAVEAVEAGLPVMQSKDIVAALDRMCSVLVSKQTGIKQEVEHKDHTLLFTHAPSTNFTLLRRCNDEGAFQGDPLAAHMTRRILESVEFFRPEISRKASVLNKIYPVLGVA